MTTQTIKPRGDLVERAKIAYFARCTQTGIFYQQPAYYSRVQEHDGKSYVVLENIHGPLAVYRVRSDGRLEYVEDYTKWPGDLGKMPNDILEAWAPGQDDYSAIVISRVGAINPQPAAIDTFDGDIGLGRDFDKDAADRLLSENGYRRIGLWQQGMGPQSDRNGYGEGNACEVVKIADDDVRSAA